MASSAARLPPELLQSPLPRPPSLPTSTPATIPMDVTARPAGLSIRSVVGTTAQSKPAVSLAGSAVAYTAGAGAVLALLDSHGASFSRFFCTPTSLVQSIHQGIGRFAWDSAAAPQPRDSYGFPCFGDDLSGVVLAPTASQTDDLFAKSPTDLTSSPRSTTSAKDRMKSSTSVALSPDSRLLAVGETGHQPRIFIYSTAPDASIVPQAILKHHRFGIKVLAWSPCGRFLASLGLENDGFLHIWHVCLKDGGTVRLHASNRCISVVNDMKWVGSSQLITVGMRHIRIWTVDTSSLIRRSAAEISPMVLAGRNVVMGNYSQLTFSAAAPLSENVVVVASDAGLVATVELNGDKIPVFTARECLPYRITALDFDAEAQVLWMADGDGPCRSMPLVEILALEITTVPEFPKSPRKKATSGSLAIYVVSPHRLLILTDRKELCFVDVASDCITAKPVPVVSSHASDVRGIAKIPGSSQFITWSVDGVVKVRSLDGTCLTTLQIDLAQPDAELTAAKVTGDDAWLFGGDSTGLVHIVSLRDGRVQNFQAHDSQIVDLDHCQIDASQVLVTCGRDRTIQSFVFDGTEWSLLQTLAAHKGNVISVHLSPGGERIVSCSADRIINIHKLAKDDDGRPVGYLSERILSLKSTPSDLEFSSGQFAVSVDKQIQVYQESGDVKTSYRTCDRIGGGLESVQLSNIAIHSDPRNSYLAGMGTDKSIRLYDHPSGTMVGYGWGHSEGVCGLVWLESERPTLVSNSSDGCIFVWDMQASADSTGLSSSPASAAKAQSSPTRKILSKAELAKFMPSPKLPPSPKVANRIPRSPGSPNSRRSMSPVARGSPTSRNGEHRAPPSPTTEGRPSPTRPQLLRPKQGSMPATGRRTLSSSRSFPVLAVKSLQNETDFNDEGIDALCRDLQQFREKYTSHKELQKYKDANGARLGWLREQLRLTLRVMDVVGDTEMEDLLQRFGSQLVSMVESKVGSPEKTND